MNQLTPVILVAPLDWGLGHATRCIPIIRYLLFKGVKVLIAAEGAQKALLKNEFPEVEIVHLEGYHLKYGKTKWQTVVAISKSIPSMLSSIKKENRWLEQLVSERKVDAVISDNRFGLYHPNIKSIFITHQLQIKSPFGFFSEKILNWWNYHQIKNFNECWVPDFERKDESLGGELSHPKKIPPISVQYLGPLSRIEKLNPNAVDDFILVILSGPEPQRSMFEKKLLQQFSLLQHKVVMVRGLPQNEVKPAQTDKLVLYNHLPSTDLNRLMNDASLIICRSGYSSVMDILRLGKKSILIPTPGQTEQEYLAKFLSQKKWCITGNDENFELEPLITKAQSLKNIPAFTENNFVKPINNFLQQLKEY